MELLLGAANKMELNQLNKKLLRFNNALINNNITLTAFELLKTYSLSHGLKIPDCLIASTAITTRLELFTYNKKDFIFIKKLELFSV
jgi:predicted nucleic acid-binding protein